MRFKIIEINKYLIINIIYNNNYKLLKKFKFLGIIYNN
jgi:hypothetical protein